MPQNDSDDIYEQFRRFIANRPDIDITTWSEERLRDELAKALEDSEQSSAENRRERRRSVMSRVTVINELEQGQGYTGLQQDISTRGTSILINRQILPGTRVIVRGVKGERTGTVRQCRRDDVGYVVGIEFDAGDEIV